MRNIFVISIGFSILLLSACSKESPKQANTTFPKANTVADTTQAGGKIINSGIVWVDMDTLLEKYLYYQDSKKQLEGSFKNKQAELERQMGALQQEIASYQQKAQEMTRVQLEEAEKTVGQKQESLMKLKTQMEESFGKEEEQLTKSLKNKINEYLRKISKENGYQYILTYNSAGLGMLYGDESLNITSSVLQDLNDVYKKEKGKK